MDRKRRKELNKLFNITFLVLIFAIIVMFFGYLEVKYYPAEEIDYRNPLEIERDELKQVLNETQIKVTKLSMDKKMVEELNTHLEKETNLDGEILKKINEAIKKSSEKYNLEEALIRAIIKQESNYDINSKSWAGARGLMQLMPETAKLLGVTNIWDIEQNIDGGCRYYIDCYKAFGNMELALAGYNAGINAVKKYGGVPPYRETKEYIKMVVYWYNIYK